MSFCVDSKVYGFVISHLSAPERSGRRRFLQEIKVQKTVTKANLARKKTLLALGS